MLDRSLIYQSQESTGNDRFSVPAGQRFPCALERLLRHLSPDCTTNGTCQQLWDTRELHLVSLDYGGETREVGAIDINIDQDLVA